RLHVFSTSVQLSTARHLSLFFFYCSRHHRALHSFPTRRSSDLPYEVAKDTQFVPTFKALALRLKLGEAGLMRSPFGWHVIKRVRSEEHTSELQSLTNLVCRLLLEKKKTKHHRHYVSIYIIVGSN